MGDALANLCAVLRAVEDPDRFNRPRDYDPRVAAERFEELTRRLDAEFGPVTSARPPDGELRGWVSLSDPVLHLIVGKFGNMVSAAEVTPELTRWLIDQKLHIGVMAPLCDLDEPAPGAEVHQPLDARTPDGLAAQILALPCSPPELGELREWLCRELDIPLADGPLRSDDYPEHQLLVEAERLRAIVRADREGPEARRWLIIDDVIVCGRRPVFGIKCIRDEFGTTLAEAQDRMGKRRAALATIRPIASAHRNS